MPYFTLQSVAPLHGPTLVTCGILQNRDLMSVSCFLTFPPFQRSLQCYYIFNHMPQVHFPAVHLENIMTHCACRIFVYTDASSNCPKLGFGD